MNKERQPWEETVDKFKEADRKNYKKIGSDN